MTTLTPRLLGDALRAGARGIHPLEAGTSLLIDCGSQLHRGDFTSRFTTTGTSISDGVTLLASIDWEAAVTALHAGELPASGGERRMLLLASSIVGGTPVSLNDTLVGIDSRNATLTVRAVAHAAGLPDPHQETDKRYLNGQFRESCVRCPVLRIDPVQRPRLADIRDNLNARIAEAEREAWLGEAEGLRVSLAAARDKLAQLDERTRRAATVSLGIPAYRDIAARTATLPGNLP